ncbi:unnamed protein product [Adineta steineri]|uniref:Cell division cycle protein 27 homolog n=1 Tax=Adineta steineri TaxID=433720 RepID=A0A815IFE2_9BILA|nr:unnamed protein product [Adineta steineri]
MSVTIDSIKIYINQFIQNFDYVDAIFLAERLYAEVKNDESTYLLARTYYLSGDINKSYWLLRNSSIEHVPNAKLLLAKCCFDIEKLHEAESVLIGNSSSITTLALDDFINDHGDQAAFALQLLAKVCEKSDRHQKASECYRKSLKINPFLWSSFEALCRLGERVDTSIFCSSAIKTNRLITELQINNTSYTESIKDIQSENQVIENSINTNTNLPIKERSQQRLSQTPAAVMKLTDSILNVGSTNISGIITSTPIGLLSEQLQDNDKYTPPTIKPPDYIPTIRNPPLAPKRQNTRMLHQYGFDDTSTSASTATILHKHDIASTSISETRKTASTRKENKSIRAPTKRNTRITKPRPPCTDVSITPVSSAESPNKMTTRSQVRSNNTSLNCSMDTEIINKRERQRKSQSNQRTPEIVENIINVFKLLGQGLQHLSQFECRQAIELFESISLKHLDTPWVLLRLANCYYHLHDYQKSSLIYRDLRTKFPYHIDGLEYYSTVLWHLKDDIALATLAHELTETDRKHPASWCASGNCLSLNHEYDKAIQAFKRAIQLAPECDYAYTLLGNEYSLIDELERAMACFRKAIQLNPRSYKAWNGVAMVYLKQEKFQSAEFHFTKATSIYRTNPDLICHLAVAQHKCNQSEGALTLLNDALKIDSKNALCKFHKAGLLLHLERYHEALTELEELRQIAPKESLVYYLLSKVHRHLKNFHYSYMYMSWSMDLDPKGANNQLKENADKLYSKDEDLLLGMEDIASSVTEDDNSQMQSQSSLQDIQPMDSILSCSESVTVQFKLRQLPRFYTPLNDKIYLATSFNQWRPNDPQFEFNSVTKSLIVDFQNLTNVEFKITRGSWATGETWADGTARANRKLSLSNNPQSIDLSVEQWADKSNGNPTATNQVYILDANFSMWNYLPRTRRIWIYLPRSYSTDLSRRYPVIYAHDAQNLFDASTSFSGEWGIDETLDNFSQELIVVGIDNGGAERINELTPFANSNYGGGQANSYLDFIVDKLRPYINTHFRTKPERENTAILGSSLGGLCSFYAAIRHESIFGLIGVFSPSFWFTNDIYNYAGKHTFQSSPPRLYFVGGQPESATMISDMQRMINLLKNTTREYRENQNNLKLIVAADGQHSEWFWRREFPNAINWLFPKN